MASPITIEPRDATATRATLGVVVIGQAPRPEIEAELRLVLGDALPIELVGALDGLARAEIDRLTPRGSDDTLFTKLPNGDGVVISKAAVARHAQARLDRLADQGTDVTLMCCTGAFPGLTARVPVVFPSAVLTSLAAALLPRGRLGVFTPLPEQADQVRHKWVDQPWQIVVEPLLPIHGPAELTAAAERMAARRPDLVILDCMSYTTAMKHTVRRITGARTLLGLSCAARAVQELLD
ncbi:MAG: AroM family protein [Proteobacteria bacterium]|nr:AroM family protein [Pseudomonadota bacterium]